MERVQAGTWIENLEQRRLFSAGLAVAFAGAFPTEISGTHAARVLVRVTNTGDQPIRGAAVRLAASADTQLDSGDAVLGSIVVGKTLKPGKSLTVKVPVNAPASLGDGNYQMLAEASGSDASVAKSLAVGPGRVPFARPFVDLRGEITEQPLEAVSFDGVGGHQPPAASVRISIANGGNTACRGPVTVEVFLSGDGALDGTSIMIAVMPNRMLHLRPGRARELQFGFRLSNLVHAGRYTLFVRLSPGDGIVDSAADNNVFAGQQPLDVVDAPLARQPNNPGPRRGGPNPPIPKVPIIAPPAPNHPAPPAGGGSPTAPPAPPVEDPDPNPGDTGDGGFPDGSGGETDWGGGGDPGAWGGDDGGSNGGGGDVGGGDLGGGADDGNDGGQPGDAGDPGDDTSFSGGSSGF